KATTLIGDEQWSAWGCGGFDTAARAERFAQAWDVAVLRATTGRGYPDLLADVDERGAEAAAWSFAQEQASDPNVLAPICRGDLTEIEREGKGTVRETALAQVAREERYETRPRKPGKGRSLAD